jgi:phospholipid transport system substrate-binding protein
MLIRRTFLLAVFALMFAMASKPMHAHAENTGLKAEEFISGLADQAIQALTTPGITKDERQNRFRAMLHDNFAIKTIARWVLGRHWKKATKEEKVEYLALFEEMLITTYVDRFSSYSGENLKVVKSMVNNPKDALVFSEIGRQGTPPLHVDWRVRTSDSMTFKIIDVMVEGVSMGQTQRSEFASVIRQNGGKVEGLLAVLRERVS